MILTTNQTTYEVNMKYRNEITIKNGQKCIIRNDTFEDGPEVSTFFTTTHGETDYLLSYPEESTRDDEKQSNYLKKTTESDRKIELLAIVDGKVVGMAGFNAIGSKYKVRHRAEFGITVSKNYWGQGIGKAIMNACIECAKEAGYIQLELDVVADNTRAIELYKKLGFIEFGRNPKGFQSKYSGFQELIYMRLEL